MDRWLGCPMWSDKMTSDDRTIVKMITSSVASNNVDVLIVFRSWLQRNYRFHLDGIPSVNLDKLSSVEEILLFLTNNVILFNMNLKISVLYIAIQIKKTDKY